MNLIWLLLGSGDSPKGKWLLTILGCLLIVMGLLVGFDTPGMVTELALEALGYGLVAAGLFRLAFSAAGVGGGLCSRFGAQGLALVILGLAIANFPDTTDYMVPWMFGAAFLIHGLYQASSALVIRYPRWQWFLASGLMHMGAGILMFIYWQQAMNLVLPLLLAVGLVVVGMSALHLVSRLGHFNVRVASQDPAERIRFYLEFHLPRRFRRPDSPAPEPPPTVGAPHGDLEVYIWTPTDVARLDNPDPNLINRYLVARDGEGKITVGHAAMGLHPDLYISHCDGDPNGYDNEAEAWRELRSRDIQGVFLPSLEEEVEHYLQPSVTLRFRNFHEDQVRTFWHMYRQITTYNLTNRNCSVAVALALEAALMGSLASPDRMRGMLRLLMNRDLWMAHFLRWKAREMVWTPGMMLDYAVALHRLVEE